MSFIGEPVPWWIVTYATLNDGLFRTLSFEFDWMMPTCSGATRSMPWASPVCRACSRAELLAIGRMISVLIFEKKHSRPVRALLAALVRRRLDSEARRLQKRYDQLKIRGDARRDVFAVADFDGALASQLGAKPGASELRVFVFGRDGKLLQQWSDVPSTEELDQALKPGGTTSASSH